MKMKLISIALLCMLGVASVAQASSNSKDSSWDGKGKGEAAPKDSKFDAQEKEQQEMDAKLNWIAENLYDQHNKSRTVSAIQMLYAEQHHSSSSSSSGSRSVVPPSPETIEEVIAGAPIVWMDRNLTAAKNAVAKLNGSESAGGQTDGSVRARSKSAETAKLRRLENTKKTAAEIAAFAAELAQQKQKPKTAAPGSIAGTSVWQLLFTLGGSASSASGSSTASAAATSSDSDN